ncbi:hypothetical protein R1flu_008906 [Riccia fluitans]|uniref:Uncharacterized protein n=1 Tax=Riccia fluitans TaxID=41844 RepID=A0ABD1Z1R8_9MARC
MKGAHQCASARKRAMILRESQNRPISGLSSDKPHNEIAQLQKLRMKRECVRSSKTLSPELLSLRTSGTPRGAENEAINSLGFDKTSGSSTTTTGDSAIRTSGLQALEAAASTPEPSEDPFHFTRQITPSVFMKQKLRLELVEKDLALCKQEKLHLQKQLQSSLQTAFKLQELIMKQKMVIELEQVVAQERGDQTEKLRMDRDELKRRLDEAIRAKEEAELTVSLSRDLNLRLFPGAEELAVTSLENSRVRLDSTLMSETEELLRQKLDENKIEAVIQQTVAECVYADTLAGRIRSAESSQIHPKELKRKLDEAVTSSGDNAERFMPQERFVVEHVAALEQELDQSRVENVVYQAVIESVYAGALEASEAKREEARQLSDSLAKKVEELKEQIVALEEKLNSCDETVELPHSSRQLPPLIQYDQDPLVPGEVATPLKVRPDVTPIRFFRSKRVTSRPPVDPLTGSPWISRSTSLDFSLVAKREATLNANLRKSMQEMEVLGGKVEEHKSILEKVTLLLSHISKSGHSANASKTLAREICDQLERYDGELK